VSVCRPLRWGEGQALFPARVVIGESTLAATLTWLGPANAWALGARHWWPCLVVSLRSAAACTTERVHRAPLVLWARLANVYI